MYLTVQRVVSYSAERGINGALYQHGTDRNDNMWDNPDLEDIVSRNLGTQVVFRNDIKPGGNAVECFLDVVFPDDFSEEELIAVLKSFREQIQSSRTTKTLGNVAIDFAVMLGESANVSQNFDQLREVGMSLFRNRDRQISQLPQPIEITATKDETAWHFELCGKSKQRFQAEFGTEQNVARINVPYEVEREFRKTYGELYPFVIEWVTNKSRDDLVRLGGVKIVYGGQKVWEWIPEHAY